MKTDEIREKYLAFFESKGHTRRPSDVLVPRWDGVLRNIVQSVRTVNAVKKSTKLATLEKYVFAAEASAQAHLHVEFYPIMRDRGKLKFLAGSESGAGVFINDTLAEESADRLRGLLE